MSVWAPKGRVALSVGCLPPDPTATGLGSPLPCAPPAAVWPRPAGWGARDARSAALVASRPRSGRGGRAQLAAHASKRVGRRDGAGHCEATLSLDTPLVQVKFSIEYDTAHGEALYLVGSGAGMGAWQMGDAPQMTWTQGGVWELELELPAGQVYEYKYVVAQLDGGGAAPRATSWQGGNNQVLALPAARPGAGRAGRRVRDAWGGSPFRRVADDIKSYLQSAAKDAGPALSRLEARIEELEKDLRRRKMRERELAARQLVLSAENARWKEKALRAEKFEGAATAVEAEAGAGAPDVDVGAIAAAVEGDGAAEGALAAVIARHQAREVQWRVEREELAAELASARDETRGLQREVTSLNRAVRMLRSHNRALAADLDAHGARAEASVRAAAEGRGAMEAAISGITDLLSDIDADLTALGGADSPRPAPPLRRKPRRGAAGGRGRDKGEAEGAGAPPGAGPGGEGAAVDLPDLSGVPTLESAADGAGRGVEAPGMSEGDAVEWPRRPGFRRG